MRENWLHVGVVVNVEIESGDVSAGVRQAQGCEKWQKGQKGSKLWPNRGKDNKKNANNEASNAIEVL